MSCERRIHTFQEVEEVRIECCDKKEIESLEKSIISAIEQKLEKLNIFIKHCNVYSDGKSIFVHDRYSVYLDLQQVAESFGFHVTEVQCSFKGKNYVITDDLCTVLKQFDSAFKFGKNVENQTLTDGVKELLSQHASLGTIHQDILEMVRNIKEHGQYVTTRSRQISEVYEEEYETLSSRLIERSQGAWDSDIDTIREKLMQVSREAQNTVNKANDQLRDGTAKLIYTRARQLGYAVQEMKKGMQTQLVLVRCE
ncbi:MAG TPA: hypothetical protein PLB63_07185 [Planctomycetota bacterium]|nr:hypothetical protein [Planctomycetota bacterium]HQB01082.1 hypothetical protein [Planctomycetota bacterium]